MSRYNVASKVSEGKVRLGIHDTETDLSLCMYVNDAEPQPWLSFDSLALEFELWVAVLNVHPEEARRWPTNAWQKVF